MAPGGNCLIYAYRCLDPFFWLPFLPFEELPVFTESTTEPPVELSAVPVFEDEDALIVTDGVTFAKLEFDEVALAEEAAVAPADAGVAREVAVLPKLRTTAV